MPRRCRRTSGWPRASGATVVRVRAERPADGLIAFAQREGVTHVIFGQSARSRWELVWRGSTLDRFLSAVPDAAVQVVPLGEGEPERQAARRGCRAIAARAPGGRPAGAGAGAGRPRRLERAGICGRWARWPSASWPTTTCRSTPRSRCARASSGSTPTGACAAWHRRRRRVRGRWQPTGAELRTRRCAVAAGNLTEPGEGDVVEAIRAGFARYLAGDPAGRAAEPLRDDTARLLAMNREAMHRKSDAAGAVARRNVVWGVALAGLLTLAGVWLTRAVATSVVRPIEALTARHDPDRRRRSRRRRAGRTRRRAGPDGAIVQRHGRAPARRPGPATCDAIAQARQVAERVHAARGRAAPARGEPAEVGVRRRSLARTADADRQPAARPEPGARASRVAAGARSARSSTLCRDDGGAPGPAGRAICSICRGSRAARARRGSCGCAAGPAGARRRRAAAAARSRPAASRSRSTCAAGLPEVDVDRAQIERVVSNLVTNGARATRPGGRVTVTATATPTRWRSMSPTPASAFPPEHLARIFEPFAQVPGGSAGGAGLGLSISRRIVEAHGGRLTVQSTPGAGSTFTFTLPRAAERAPQETAI